MQYIAAVLYGIVFGIANIIPGVSGGTMLVVFGCYDKVCGALTLDFKEIKKHFKFLIFFGIGAVIGIIGFAHVITWLFSDFPVQTNMFFMGLIVGSVPLILKNATVKEKFRPTCIIPFVIGLAAVVGLALAESGSSEPFSCKAEFDGRNTSIVITNDSNKTISDWTLDLDCAVENVRGGSTEVHYSVSDKIKGIFGMKIPAYGANRIVSLENEAIPPHGEYTVTVENADISHSVMELNASYAMNVGFFITMVAAMFVAAIAMIIPGVSGSFVMMTVGVYPTVIAAVKNLDFAVIFPCAVGAVIGLVAGARLITMLMKKYSLMVYSTILGLVAGSVYVIFPTGFGLNGATLAGFVCLAVGAVISAVIGRNTKVGE